MRSRSVPRGRLRPGGVRRPAHRPPELRRQRCHDSGLVDETACRRSRRRLRSPRGSARRRGQTLIACVSVRVSSVKSSATRCFEELAECANPYLLLIFGRYRGLLRRAREPAWSIACFLVEGLVEFARNQDSDGAFAEVDRQLPSCLPERLYELVRTDDETVLP